MIKTFVFPVVGKCQHAVFVAESGWTMSHSVCAAFLPPDDARFQSYNLAYDDIAADQNLWRPATRLETVIFLADLEEEDLDQLIAG